MRVNLFLLLLTLTISALACDRNDAKSSESRIFSEINQMTEESRMRMHTPEIRASLNRMKELRPQFPENREELENEAKTIRDLYVALIADNAQESAKWEELLALPLAENYRTCVQLQIRSTNASSERLKLAIEEMDLLLDRTIGDNASLESALNPLRVRQGAFDSQNAEIDADIAANCKRPQ